MARLSIRSGADEIYAVTPDIGQLLHTIAVSARPAGIAVRPDGKRLLVADPVQNEVLVVNLATTNIVARVPTGGAPTVVAISPDGTTTLTGNSASTMVDVVDTGTSKITSVFEAGASPGALAVTPDGSRVFVADQGPSGYNGGVMVIDTTTFRRLAQIPVPGAATVAILPIGSTVYCGSNRLLGSNNGAISVIDASTYRITTTIVLGTISASVPNLAISPDGSKLYAAYTDLSGENTLAVISTLPTW
jgi:YVTN family beta-propeller protein